MSDIKVVHQNGVAPLANERLGGLAKEVWDAVGDSGDLQSARFDGGAVYRSCGSECTLEHGTIWMETYCRVQRRHLGCRVALTVVQLRLSSYWRQFELVRCV